MEPIATQLHDILTEEYLLSGELLALIGQEKQQLASGDQEAMNACIRTKRHLLEKLEGVTTGRIALLQDAGFDEADALPGKWTAALGEFPALARQHALLLELVQKLREENQTLGLLLNRKTHFVTRLLDTLKPSTIDAGIYQSNGSRHPGAGTRKLVSV